MGSTLSTTSETEKTGETQNHYSSVNNNENSAKQAQASKHSGRKRKRSEISNEDDLSSRKTTFLRSKKPRTTSIWSRFNLASTWDALADSFTCYFAKLFLKAAEMACKNARPGELANEVDLIHGVCQSLDCYQKADKDILRRGWRVLCACSRDCDHNAIKRLFDEQSTIKSDIAAVLTAMERHSDRIDIQLLGFRAIRQLTNQCENSWETLEGAQPIHVFLLAMRKHANDVVVQGLSITFLAMLVRESHGQSRELIINLGGIDDVITAMRTFHDDGKLVHTAFFALHAFGFQPRMREIISSLHGRELFIEILQKHMSDSDVADLCLAALGKLNEDASRVDTILPVVLQVLTRWPHSPSTQGHGLALITRGIGRMPLHSVEAAIQHRLLVDAVMEHIVMVMKNHRSDSTLQFFGCAVMREILERIPMSTIRRRLLDSGGMECVLQALQNHRDTYGILPMGLLVMLDIYENRSRSELPASIAFGSSQRAIATIFGVTIRGVPGDHAGNDN